MFLASMRIRGKLDYSYYIDIYDFDSSILYVFFFTILSRYRTTAQFLTLKLGNKNNHAFFFALKESNFQEIWKSNFYAIKT